jgi:hypothetical protein
MLEFLLATVISLSVGVREPRQNPDANFDYELSYKVENTYKGLESSFKHDYEREDGSMFNDIKGELNYTRNIKWKGTEFKNQQIIIKEDYKQISSKDLYQLNSDIRYQIYGISAGYGMVWDLKDNYTFTPSLGFSKKVKLGGWEIETENDLYFTNKLTYQLEGKVIYNINKHLGIGFNGNYIETLDNYDYTAKVVFTIKLQK